MEVDLLISAYRGRDLQQTAQIMEQCKSEGLSLDDCLGVIRQGLADLSKPPLRKKCPNGCGDLNPVVTGEAGVEIIGCRECRYSEVVK